MSREGSYTMMGVFLCSTVSIKSKGCGETRESLLSRFEVFFERSVDCRMSEELDRCHDESEVFEVGRTSLEEKIGIGDQKVLLAKPWSSGDSE